MLNRQADRPQFFQSSPRGSLLNTADSVFPIFPDRPRIPDHQKENIKTLFQDLAASVDQRPSQESVQQLAGTVTDAAEDGKLNLDEVKAIAQDTRSMVDSMGVTDEERQILVDDVKTIYQESRLPKLPDEQKENIAKLIEDVKGSVDQPPSRESVEQLVSTIQVALEDGQITLEEALAIVEDGQVVLDEMGLTPEDARTIFYDLQDIAEASRLPRTDDYIEGTNGSDLLYGGLGNDTLVGNPTNGDVPEMDLFYGGGGQDTFVLGDANQAFYNDSQPLTFGSDDLAVLLDFNLAQDTIQLHGSEADYALSTIPAELGLTGTAIYLTAGQALPELIGVVAGVEMADFSAGFTFTQPVA